MLKSRRDIVENWLPRYTGLKLEEFGDYILLTNFDHYVKVFARWGRVPVKGKDKPMCNATKDKITIIKHRTEVGDFILPIAAIRGEGASNDYYPPEVPALPAFALQKAISTTIRDHCRDYWTGTVYTTNRRVWEHDTEFKKYLKKIRVLAIDMETATIFMTGFYNEIPTGALLLVSDQPMAPEGIKTAESDKAVDDNFVSDHIRIGIDSLKQLINKGLTVKHLQF